MRKIKLSPHKVRLIKKMYALACVISWEQVNHKEMVAAIYSMEVGVLFCYEKEFLCGFHDEQIAAIRTVIEIFKSKFQEAQAQEKKGQVILMKENIQVSSYDLYRLNISFKEPFETLTNK